MSVATKSNKNKTTIQSRVISTTLPKYQVEVSDADILAQKYLDLKMREELLKEERESLNEAVKALAVDKVLSSSLGDFVIQNRRTMTWSLSVLKSILGREWTSFVTPDNKLVKARMENKDEVGCLLECEADVTVSEAVTFKKN